MCALPQAQAENRTGMTPNSLDWIDQTGSTRQNRWLSDIRGGWRPALAPGPRLLSKYSYYLHVLISVEGNSGPLAMRREDNGSNRD
jgi:hypothetical protein